MCSNVPLFVNMLNADACEENGKQHASVESCRIIGFYNISVK